MTKLSLTDELHRQIKEELKGLEPNKQQEIMMFQKYGIMQALLTEAELAVCIPVITGGLRGSYCK